MQATGERARRFPPPDGRRAQTGRSKQATQNQRVASFLTGCSRSRGSLSDHGRPSKDPERPPPRTSKSHKSNNIRAPRRPRKKNFRRPGGRLEGIPGALLDTPKPGSLACVAVSTEGMRARHEAHVSTEQPAAQEDAWFPRSHGDEGWPARVEAPTCPRSQASLRLNSTVRGVAASGTPCGRRCSVERSSSSSTGKAGNERVPISWCFVSIAMASRASASLPAARLAAPSFGIAPSD